MEAKTERELIIQVNGKVDLIAESMERLTNVLEKLENVKFQAHEERLLKVERFVNQWGGALIAFNIAAVIIGILISLFK